MLYVVLKNIDENIPHITAKKLYFKILPICRSYVCGVASGNTFSSSVKIIATPIAMHEYSTFVSVLCECPTIDFSIAKTNEEIGVLNASVNQKYTPCKVNFRH